MEKVDPETLKKEGYIDFTALEEGAEVIVETCGGIYSLKIIDPKECLVEFKGKLGEKEPNDLVKFFENPVKLHFMGSVVSKISSMLYVKRMCRDMCMELSVKHNGKQHILRSAPVEKATIFGDNYKYNIW